MIEVQLMIHKLWGSPFIIKILHSLMHIDRLIEMWIIETEYDMGVMMCISQGGLCSPGIPSDFTFTFTFTFIYPTVFI